VSAVELEFLSQIATGKWGERARRELFKDMSGGDAELTRVLEAASSIGGVRALGDVLAEVRPDWRPKDPKGVGHFLARIAVEDNMPVIGPAQIEKRKK
jgi:hypothetical protein